MSKRALILVILGAFAAGAARGQPPFHGTVFVAPALIPSDAPSQFESASYHGRALRNMYDRRSGAFEDYEAYLFEARYADGLTIEFQVNPEFDGEAAAREIVLFYAEAIGRLPRALRTQVRTSWIHQGDELFGGGNDNLLVHTGKFAQQYRRDGVLEEALVHEAAHTSLDAAHATAQAWLAAQQLDGEFISDYAAEHPEREDVAESIVPWLALRCARARLEAGKAAQFEATMPNRLAYFDSLDLELRPLECEIPDAAPP